MNRYKRTCRRVGAFALALAAAIRLTAGTGLDRRLARAARRAADSRDFVSFAAYLELGRVGRWPAETETAPETPPETVPETSPETITAAETETITAAETETAAETGSAAPDRPSPAPFTAADADGIAVGGACTYPVDKAALLTAPVKLNFAQSGPTVLIVHTHTSEAYTQEAGWEYAASDTLRTEDPDYSVVRVGKEIADALTERGIAVVHDASLNDYPSYNGAYARTLTKIEAWLKRYPSIQTVIDVHRDAASDADGNPIGSVVTVNGEESAQIMLVMGTDEGGLAHPNWRDNLSWALKLQATLNREYPGLCRDVDLRTERFNQHATRGSMLVEVGSGGNTLRQAVTAARDFGEGLADLILAQGRGG